MYFTPNRKYDCNQCYDLILDLNNYIHDHCWGCDKEFEDKEPIFQLLNNKGLYCNDCHDRLSSALITDAVKNESEE